MTVPITQQLQRSLWWKKCQDSNAWEELWRKNTESGERLQTSLFHCKWFPENRAPDTDTQLKQKIQARILVLKGQRILYTDVYLVWASALLLAQWLNTRSWTSRSRCSTWIFAIFFVHFLYIHFLSLTVLFVPCFLSSFSSFIIFTFAYQHTPEYFVFSSSDYEYITSNYKKQF
jgi:hypothetical protein